jgi:hypothetical protein
VLISRQDGDAVLVGASPELQKVLLQPYAGRTRTVVHAWGTMHRVPSRAACSSPDECVEAHHENIIHIGTEARKDQVLHHPSGYRGTSTHQLGT